MRQVAKAPKDLPLNPTATRTITHRWSAKNTKPSLAIVAPVVASEWHLLLNGSLTPDKVAPGSSAKAWWYCRKCDYSWPAVIATRVNGIGCPVEAGKAVKIGLNDLATLRPDLASQWNVKRNGELSPNQVTLYSGQTVWWYCSKCDYEWPTIIKHRSNGSQCPIETGRAVKPGLNDLATLRPDLTAQWSSSGNLLQPDQVRVNGNQKFAWYCSKCDYEWSATPNHRNRNLGVKCPVCLGQKVKIGLNDLATLFPDLAMDWHPTLNGSLLPTQVPINTHKEVWWQCSTCQNEWNTRIDARVRGNGCSQCAQYGFKINLPGYVYLISKQSGQHTIIQFGISNTPEVRLRKHRKSGFKNPPLLLLFFHSGREARALEKRLMLLMEEYSLSSCSKQGIVFDGSTESFILDDATPIFLAKFAYLLGE